MQESQKHPWKSRNLFSLIHAAVTFAQEILMTVKVFVDSTQNVKT